MKGSDLRGIVLNKFYERRTSRSFHHLTVDDFYGEHFYEDLKRIWGQLDEYGLIKSWRADNTGAGNEIGIGKISAYGADIVEGESSPEIAINVRKNNNIRVTASKNVQIGNDNYIGAQNGVQEILKAIARSGASDEDKNEAKSRLRQFLENPTVSSVIGVLAGMLSSWGLR